MLITAEMNAKMNAEMNRTNNDYYTIINNTQEHSLNKNHNEDYEQSKYLFSLFDDKSENADELIIDFANKYGDFMVRCYVANIFEVTADAFMLATIFNKQNVINKLLETNKHKLDSPYAFGLGMNTTPRELIEQRLNVAKM